MTRLTAFVLAFLLAACCCSSDLHAQLNWDTRFTRPGVIGYQPRFSLDQDSSLIVSGLDFINGICIQPAAVFNKGEWHQLGKWDRSYYLYGPFLFQGRLHSIGRFRGADGLWSDGLARYDQNEWHLLIKPNKSFSGIIVDSIIYLYGSFDSIDGRPANGFAAWNCTSFTAIDLDLPPLTGSSSFDKGITHIEKYNGSLYMVGYFSFTDSVTSRYIVRYDPADQRLSSVGTGTDAIIWDLQEWRGDLYATGQFNEAGGKGAYHFARWNGNTWSPVGTARDVLTCYSASMTTFRNELLVFGGVTKAGRIPISSIASWNGVEWSAKFDRADRRIEALMKRGDELIAYFDSNGWHTEISSFKEGAWTPIPFPSASGMRGLIGKTYDEPVISSIAATNDHLYVTGDFVCFSSTGDSIRNFARFDGDQWESVLDTTLKGAKLYSNKDRLFLTTDYTLSEVIDGQLREIMKTGATISDVAFDDKHIYVGYNLDDESSIVKASLKDLRFETTGAKHRVRAIAKNGELLYYLSDDRLYQVEGEAEGTRLRSSSGEYLSDIAAVGDMIYVVGSFTNPDGFLTRCRIDGGVTTQDVAERGPYYYGSRADRIINVGTTTFLVGSLGTLNGDQIYLAKEHEGNFTFLSDWLVSDNEELVEFKGDLYISGTKRIGEVQSSGLARAFLGASRVDPNRNDMTPTEHLEFRMGLVTTANTLRLDRPANRLRDPLGKSVRLYNEARDIDIRGLPAGLYFIQFSDGSSQPLQILR
jgi:hypothetical protein